MSAETRAEIVGYAEAHALVAEYARRLGTRSGPGEPVSLAEARGRIVAQPVTADLDQPPFARATRDGFACRAADAACQTWLPVAGATHAGQTPPPPLPPGSAWEIMTGAPMPPGADAVVMVEHVEREPGRMRLAPARQIHTGENVVERGAQARAGEELISRGTRMGPAQIALAASCGYTELRVAARPRVAILTTGDELVAPGQKPGPGQIRNSNAPMLQALVSEAGGEAEIQPAARDTPGALDRALAACGDADLLLISGGVSAGRFDLVEPALERSGARFFFTGVRMQPGKPLVFGEAVRGSGSAQPFFGLPGNPISSAVTFLLFAAQLVAALAGARETGPRMLLAELGQPAGRGAKPGLARFLPGFCRFDTAGRPQVETVAWQGSGDLPAFARANCLVFVPEETGTLTRGATVRILMI